jgi:hypothetical protein
MIINIHLSSHQTSTHSTLKDNRQKKWINKLHLV